MKRLLLLSSLLPLAGLGIAVAPARSSGPPRVVPFASLSLTIEINDTDQDVGVLFRSDSSLPIRWLTMTNPDGAEVYSTRSSDPVDLGLTELFWETAEPDITKALLAYPEGEYTVLAEAIDGTVIRGKVFLSHETLEAPEILEPADGEVLPLNDVEIEWDLDPSAASYWLEFGAIGTPSYTIPLKAGTDSFKFPKKLLAPLTAYKATLGAVHANGNAIASEVEFETGKK